MSTMGKMTETNTSNVWKIISRRMALKTKIKAQAILLSICRSKIINQSIGLGKLMRKSHCDVKMAMSMEVTVRNTRDLKGCTTIDAATHDSLKHNIA